MGSQVSQIQPLCLGKEAFGVHRLLIGAPLVAQANRASFVHVALLARVWLVHLVPFVVVATGLTLRSTGRFQRRSCALQTPRAAFGFQSFAVLVLRFNSRWFQLASKRGLKSALDLVLAEVDGRLGHVVAV
jgi:hypothetical protein